MRWADRLEQLTEWHGRFAEKAACGAHKAELAADFADYLRTYGQLIADAKRAGVTVMQALDCSREDCEAMGIKPTQKLSEFLARLVTHGPTATQLRHARSVLRAESAMEMTP
jgi:hypothetical protein